MTPTPRLRQTIVSPTLAVTLAMAAMLSSYAYRVDAASPDQAVRGAFRAQFSPDAGGLVSLKRACDAGNVEFVAPGRRLGEVIVRCRRVGGPWQESGTSASADCRRVEATGAAGGPGLCLV
jgi:hypothetical protein